MPRICSAKTAPIVANWSRCSGRASAFAPASIRTDGPRLLGIGTPIAGRITPGIRRSSISPAASIAPVFPAETTASADPSATARTAATRELSGFERTASAGFSSISITSAASWSSSPPVSSPAGPKSTGTIVSLAASRAPATTSAGPRSPPIASTAIRITALRGVDTERLDVAATVRAAGRAEVMRALGIPARPANVHLGGADRMRRPTLVAARFRCFSLGDGHERWPV